MRPTHLAESRTGRMMRLDRLARPFHRVRLASEERLEIRKAREPYPRSDEKLTKARITERLELRFTHAGVRGIEGRIDVTGVAN